VLIDGSELIIFAIFARLCPCLSAKKLFFSDDIFWSLFTFEIIDNELPKENTRLRKRNM
jgi:hypothetical protein